MKISELHVKNVQIHKDLTVKFSKGVNVIVGDTNKGKSSLLRALRLILDNQPRSGERIYKRIGSKNPLMIEVKDGEGNSIKRSINRYYLNGALMKAYNTTIPEPVKEIFPLKEVNWQRQLDPHFLVLETGGGAAKILNTYSGMEDQEALMKDVKARITDHKSNINRLIKNNQEQRDIVDELKPVVRLVMKAKAIKNIIDNAKINQQQLDQLEKIILDIESCKFDESIYDNITYGLEKIEKINELENERKELNQSIKHLEQLCLELGEVQKIKDKSETCNKLIHSLDLIIEKQKQNNVTTVMINQLSTLINEIRKVKKDREVFESELGRIEDEFFEKLLEVGQCPYCGTNFKNGNHKC